MSSYRGWGLVTMIRGLELSSSLFILQRREEGSETELIINHIVRSHCGSVVSKPN